MKKIIALLAVLLVLPVVYASHSYGSYDYSYDKDFEYVRYSENEHASRSHDSCGYYDYDYYGSTYGCGGYGDNYEYHRSRDFEFGRYHEDVRSSGDRGYYGSYDSYHYPSQGDDYGYDYEGGRYDRGSYYMPYGY